eukprot:SAG22_NODE_11427_length_485_cov_1.725389_1_plen_59_part_10
MREAENKCKLMYGDDIGLAGVLAKFLGTTWKPALGFAASRLYLNRRHLKLSIISISHSL